mgnify:CR=1 FL=1
MPQNVFVLRDIMCNGYVAGANTRFFGEFNTPGAKPETMMANAISQDLQKRLAFDEGTAGDYGSLLAFACKHGSSYNAREAVVALSSRLLPWEVRATTDPNGNKDQRMGFPGGMAGYRVYSAAYGLHTIHYGEDARAVETQEFIVQGSLNNALCFLGPHRKYHAFNPNSQELVPGQGHFGPDAVTGDARWRRGEAVDARGARAAMVGIEQVMQAQMNFTKSS